MASKVIYLYSSLATDQIQIVNSRRLEDILISKKLKFDKVDGSLAEMKDTRDKLFSISNTRGKYPQCFIETPSVTQFVGLWETIEGMIECDSLPSDILAANPTILTFDKVRDLHITTPLTFLLAYFIISLILGLC